jgi:hypothetical protein
MSNPLNKKITISFETYPVIEEMLSDATRLSRASKDITFNRAIVSYLIKLEDEKKEISKHVDYDLFVQVLDHLDEIHSYQEVADDIEDLILSGKITNDDLHVIRLRSLRWIKRFIKNI